MYLLKTSCKSAHSFATETGAVPYEVNNNPNQVDNERGVYQQLVRAKCTIHSVLGHFGSFVTSFYIAKVYSLQILVPYYFLLFYFLNICTTSNPLPFW